MPEVEVRDERGKLLLTYNSESRTITVQRRGIKSSITLDQLDRAARKAAQAPRKPQ